jgi:hypothetical protein
MAFTRNSLKILAKGPKNGSSLFLTIFWCRVKFRNLSNAPKILRSLNLEKMVLIIRTFGQFHCSVSFSRYLSEWSCVAGFRKNRSWTEQVLALTSFLLPSCRIYWTIWCQTVFFQVFLGDKSSRWRRLNNELPQGSVLVALLFNLYLSDIPLTLSNQFQYADDIALTYQHDWEANLEVDRERLNQYFHRWRLQPNPCKTESCVFYLSTRHANRTLDIQFAAKQIQHIEHP